MSCSGLASRTASCRRPSHHWLLLALLATPFLAGAIDAGRSPGLQGDGPRGRISGSDGAPVQDAVVDLVFDAGGEVSHLPPEQRRWITDSAGEFPLPEDDFPILVDVSHVDHALARVWIGTPEDGSIRLESGVRHEILVLNAASGLPVEGAAVTVEAARVGSMTLRPIEGITARSGRFATQRLPAGSLTIIRVVHPEYAPDVWRDRVPCTGGCLHRMPLAPPATLTVKVTTPSGEPASVGGNVTAILGGPAAEPWEAPDTWEGSFVRSAPIGPGGVARLKGVRPGKAVLWATVTGYGASSKFVVILAGDEEAKIQLAEGRGVSGRVVDAKTSAPVPGATVSLVGGSNPHQGHPHKNLPSSDDAALAALLAVTEGVLGSTTDAAGGFSLTACHRNLWTYSIRVRAEGYAQRITRIGKDSDGPVVVKLVPESARPKIVGRIVDGKGRPVAGALLRSPVGTTRTDSDGRFELRLVADEGTFEVSASGFETRLLRWRNGNRVREIDPSNASLWSSRDPAQLDAIPLRRARVIEGRLEPAPPPHTRVWIVAEVPGKYRTETLRLATVRSDGGFRFVHEGDRSLELILVSGGDRSPTGKRVPEDAVDLVIPWKGPTEERPRGDIHLIVVDAESGLGIPGYKAFARNSRGGHIDAEETDRAGGCYLRGVGAGPAWVEAGIHDYKSEAIVVEVLAGDVVEARIPLRPMWSPGNATLVVDASGIEKEKRGWGWATWAGSVGLRIPSSGVQPNGRDGVFTFLHSMVGEYYVGIDTKLGQLPLGLVKFEVGDKKRFSVSIEGRGELLVRARGAVEGWVQLRREGRTFYGSDSLEWVKGSTPRRQECTFLLEPGEYEVVIFGPRGLEKRSARIEAAGTSTVDFISP